MDTFHFTHLVVQYTVCNFWAQKMRKSSLKFTNLEEYSQQKQINFTNLNLRKHCCHPEIAPSESIFSTDLCQHNAPLIGKLILELIPGCSKLRTPRKTNMDTQNDGMEKVTPFEYGHFWIFLVSMLNLWVVMVFISKIQHFRLLELIDTFWRVSRNCCRDIPKVVDVKVPGAQ